MRCEEYYDQILAVNVACQSGHWNIITLLARTRGLQPEIVAALSQIIQSTNMASPSNYEFLLALSEPSLTQSLLIYPSFGQKIFDYIRTNIDSFPIEILQRFALQLDPSQPSALPIITCLFKKHKSSTSLDSTLEIYDTINNADLVAINAKECIETFIWIVIELISRTSNDNL